MSGESGSRLPSINQRLEARKAQKDGKLSANGNRSRCQNQHNLGPYPTAHRVFRSPPKTTPWRACPGAWRAGPRRKPVIIPEHNPDPAQLIAPSVSSQRIIENSQPLQQPPVVFVKTTQSTEDR